MVFKFKFFVVILFFFFVSVCIIILGSYYEGIDLGV